MNDQSVKIKTSENQMQEPEYVFLGLYHELPDLVIY